MVEMSDRGDYKVRVRLTTEREVIVNADGFDDAEFKAIKKAVSLVDGYDAEVLWAVEHGSLSDWEKNDGNDS
jgi:hypothetical protein